MDKRLTMLDSINSKVTEMSHKMSEFDTRVCRLESGLSDHTGKIADLERSREFDSQTCDEIKHTQAKYDQLLSGEKARSEALAKQVTDLQSDFVKLSDDNIDLQARSMRDNLLFFNFDECQSPQERSQEQCATTIEQFISTKLDIADVVRIVLAVTIFTFCLTFYFVIIFRTSTPISFYRN